MSTLDESMLMNLIDQTIAKYQQARYVSPLRFSADYRQVTWCGKCYNLTKLQAAVLEALVQENGYAHRDLLCAKAGTNEALHRIFRNKVSGQYVAHPLWSTLIQSCGDGYYLLSKKA